MCMIKNTVILFSGSNICGDLCNRSDVVDGSCATVDSDSSSVTAGANQPSRKRVLSFTVGADSAENPFFFSFRSRSEGHNSDRPVTGKTAVSGEVRKMRIYGHSDHTAQASDIRREAGNKLVCQNENAQLGLGESPFRPTRHCQ